jgi:hypothetical protein
VKRFTRNRHGGRLVRIHTADPQRLGVKLNTYPTHGKVVGLVLHYLPRRGLSWVWPIEYHLRRGPMTCDPVDEILAAVEERRQDSEFMARLDRSMTEHAAVLNRLEPHLGPVDKSGSDGSDDAAEDNHDDITPD